MSPDVLQINLWQGFFGIAAILVGGGMAFGTLKNSVSNLENGLSNIQKILDDEIRPDLKNLRERFIVVEERTNILWKDKIAPANSPRKLNEWGNKILAQSGIKEIIEQKQNYLLTLAKEKSFKNPYDAEEGIIEITNTLKADPAILEAIKNGAYPLGADVDTVLLVGSLYLRDLIFPQLGFPL